MLASEELRAQSTGKRIWTLIGIGLIIQGCYMVHPGLGFVATGLSLIWGVLALP